MNLSDIILNQVTKSVAGSNIQIPQNLQQQVLGGLSDSILGSLAKTATAPGGLDQIKELLTGKADAAKSPVTALAGNIFNSNVLSKLKEIEASYRKRIESIEKRDGVSFRLDGQLLLLRKRDDSKPDALLKEYRFELKYN